MALRTDDSPVSSFAKTMSGDAYEVLFERHPANPILKATQWPYMVHSVFNPGSVRLRDGRTLLLVRCEDRRGFSHLCKAVSEDGVSGWEIDRGPTLQPEPDKHPEELWGIEDARITFVEELDAYLVAYTAYGPGGPGVALAQTKDFVRFQRLGLVMQPDDKDAALFPRRFDGDFLLIHRPTSHLGAHIWLSRSPNLKNWGAHKLIIPARRGAWWDANKVGLATPPIETEKGWLILYHGVRTHASGSIYRTGLALLDREQPDRCLLRGEPWIFGPEEPYEMNGDVGQVVFPTGVTIGDDGDTLNMYYGAADTSVCLAQGSIRKLLSWLERFGSTLTGTSGHEGEAQHFSHLA